MFGLAFRTPNKTFYLLYEQQPHTLSHCDRPLSGGDAQLTLQR
jgi:hypothetical protein